MAEKNPSSVENDGKRFKRAIFSFHACMIGFKRACKLLLFINGMYLLGRYRGILLGTIGKDWNESFSHVAFTIIDNETNDN